MLHPAKPTYLPLVPRQRPYERDCEWNRLIKSMTVAEYCDWRNAGRPGFADMQPHQIRGWLKERDDVRERAEA